jgi:hypothetical protein
MNGVFIIELSAADSDEQRNVQMLKENPWFDIPIAYSNGSRAIGHRKGSAGVPRVRRRLRGLGEKVRYMARRAGQPSTRCSSLQRF